MASSILAPRAVDFTVELIQNTLQDLAEKSSYSLEDSIHAPANIRRQRQRFHASNSKQSNSSKNINTSNKSLAHRNSFSPSTSISGKGRKQAGAMAGYSKLDDTAGFMDAVRRRNLGTTRTSANVPAGSDSGTHAEQNIRKSMNNENSNIVPVGLTSEKLSGPGTNKPGNNYDSQPGLLASKWADEAAAASSLPRAALEKLAAPSAASIGSVSNFAGRKVGTDHNILQGETSCPTNKGLLSTNGETSRDEDRMNLITFKTWGTPITRDKPAAKVRRIILRALPPNYNTPTKALSLIHGSMIENVSISPSGDAHVLFCDATACKAYYDKYPNGIPLGRDGRNVVFVDLGREVDVMSSQLSNYLSAGASRVVRAVGLELNLSTEQLFDLASASHRKVEKIIDTYVPQESRVVHFRFCSIDDAVRFKAAIVRDDDWEHCNIQFAPDP
ncbi:hypothetical protein Egran_02385 [Elaphomyces granulatus]|uniref:Uncharacterized protein n=1 Tax=Elaphomyces granulatus TaxID=519963 RepID=A0A232M0B9_9EURO|nr:hypothetical protein Egran_02385 [Elaphomyces granulatus]